MKKVSIARIIEKDEDGVVNIDSLHEEIQRMIKDELFGRVSITALKKIVPYVECETFKEIFKKDLYDTDLNELYEIVIDIINKEFDNALDEVSVMDSKLVYWEMFDLLLDEHCDDIDSIESFSEYVAITNQYEMNCYAGEYSEDGDGFNDYPMSSLKKAIYDLYRYFINEKLNSSSD